MRQAHLVAPRTIEWRESQPPDLGPGELLVHIRAALTCGTDLKTYRRGHPKLNYGPFGHEASGEVAAVGAGVDRFAPGEAIMWVQTAPCGSCGPCRSSRENLCERLFERIALGTYGDRVVLPAHVVEQNVYRKPAHLTFVEAAFLEPYACVVHGWNVLRRANATSPLPGEVTIVGAGTIGLLHLVYAAHAGVKATVIARGEARQRLASQMGAADVIDADDEQRTAALRGSCESVIECGGTPEGWRAAVRLARPGGRVLFFSGLPAGTDVALDAGAMHYAELTCIGTFHFTPLDVREAFESLSWGGVDVRPLISGVHRLDDLAAVFERLDRREGHKFALIPGPGPARWI
jgi:L-iditol 2-dehydrogenase